MQIKSIKEQEIEEEDEDEEDDEDEANARVEQPVDHIVSALIHHLKLIEEGFDENRLRQVVRSDIRYGRAASSMEAAQVLTTAIMQF